MIHRYAKNIDSPETATCFFYTSILHNCSIKIIIILNVGRGAATKRYIYLYIIIILQLIDFAKNILIKKIQKFKLCQLKFTLMTKKFLILNLTV